jgi:type IV secretory pathway TrbF-like protein
MMAARARTATGGLASASSMLLALENVSSLVHVGVKTKMMIAINQHDISGVIPVL